MSPNKHEIQRNLTNNDIFECTNKIFVPAVCCLETYYSFYAGEHRQRIQLQTNRLVNAWVCCAFAAIYKPSIKWSSLASAEGASEEKLSFPAGFTLKEPVNCLEKNVKSIQNKHSVKRTGSRRPCFCAHPPLKSVRKGFASTTGAGEEKLAFCESQKSKKCPKNALFCFKTLQVH